MLMLIFICRLLCRVTNRVWKWCGVANHVPVVRIIAVSPPYTLHKQHDEVRKSALHHGEEPGTRQQSTSRMYIGQSWNRVNATKTVTFFNLLQETGKPWRGKSTNKSHKMQHLGVLVRCFTLDFLFFCCFTRSSCLFHGHAMARATNCYSSQCIGMNILIWNVFQETCSSFPYTL